MVTKSYETLKNKRTVRVCLCVRQENFQLFPQQAARVWAEVGLDHTVGYPLTFPPPGADLCQSTPTLFGGREAGQDSVSKVNWERLHHQVPKSGQGSSSLLAVIFAPELLSTQCCQGPLSSGTYSARRETDLLFSLAQGNEGRHETGGHLKSCASVQGARPRS